MRARRSPAVLSFVALAAALLTTGARAEAGIPRFELDLPIDRDNQGLLVNAKAMATDIYGRVLVVSDSQPCTGTGCTPTPALDAFTAIGEQSFHVPGISARSLFSDSLGHTWYPTSTGLGRIDASGSALAPPACIQGNLDPTSPTTFAEDAGSPSNGHVLYVLNAGSLLTLDPTNDTASSCGFAAASALPSGPIVVAPDHTLLVLATGGSTPIVYHYNDQGVLLGRFAVPAAPNGDASNPDAMTIDGDGALLFADRNGSVIRTTTDGTRLSGFGQRRPNGAGTSGPPAAPAPGQFDVPAGISVDCRGRLYVLDLGPKARPDWSASSPPVTPADGRVARYRHAAAAVGRCADELPRTTTPAPGSAVAAGPAGTTYQPLDQGVVGQVDAAGQVTARLGHAGSRPGTADPGLVSSLAVLPGGDVLTASTLFASGDSVLPLDPKLVRFHAAGAVVQVLRTVTGPGGSYRFGFPFAVALRPSDGHVLVADRPYGTTRSDGTVVGKPIGDIVELDANLALLRVLALPAVTPAANFRQATAIAPSPVDGSIWVGLGESSGTGLTRQVVDTVVHLGPSGESLAGGFTAPVYSGAGETVTGIVPRPDGSFLLTVAGFQRVFSTNEAVNPMGVLEVTAGGTVRRRLAEDLADTRRVSAPTTDCRGRPEFVVDTGLLVRLDLAGGDCVVAPRVLSAGVTRRSRTGLTVRVVVDAASQATEVRLLYGLRSSRGRGSRATAWVAAGSDNVAAVRDLVLTKLKRRTAYRVAVQVRNASGTVTTRDQAVRTSN